MKTKRKFLSMVVLLSFMLTLFGPMQAFASYDKDLEKAISTAKAKVSVPASYDKFTYNIYKENDNMTFNLTWEDSKNAIGSINISIDSEGLVRNYNSYKYSMGNDKRKLPLVSKAEGQKTSNAFIKKIAPELVNKTKSLDNSLPFNIGERSYQYIYYRMENGVSFPENNINVNVDNITGEVTNYYCTWNNKLVFPDLAGTKKIDEGRQIFSDKLGLKLVYKLPYSQDGSAPYLAYTTVYSNKFIDAKTGELIPADNYYAPNYQRGTDGYGKGGGIGMTADTKNELTPQEQQAVEKAGDIMDEKSAEAKARELLSIGSTYKLASINLYTDWANKDQYQWNLQFNKEGTNYSDSIGVTLNSNSGEIVNYYKSIPYDEKSKVNYSEEQAKTIATTFAQKLQAQKFAETELTDWMIPYTPYDQNGQIRQSSFNFTRKVNDAYFMDNGINVVVDNTTGEVTNYNCNWYTKSIPNPAKKISLDEAYKVLFEKIGFQMQYVSIIKKVNGKMPINIYPNSDRDVKLVFAINPEKQVNIDAISGNSLDYSGKPIKEAGIAHYSDIKGNFAEKQINVLADYGISLPGTEFLPNKNATQREFLYMLQKSISPWMDLKSPDPANDDSLYNSLASMGIVKQGERAPGSVINRQDSVKFIVRALGYDKVAEIKKPVFTLPFKDAKNINANLYGYVAVAYGLNLVNGNNGNFNPTSGITRAQASIILYNFLNVN